MSDEHFDELMKGVAKQQDETKYMLKEIQKLLEHMLEDLDEIADKLDVPVGGQPIPSQYKTQVIIPKKNIETARNTLLNHLSKTKEKLSKPRAIEVIIAATGVHRKTAKDYLLYILTAEPKIKTNIYEIWVE